MMLDYLHAWLTDLSGPKGSDLYITVGAPPILRGDAFTPLIDDPLQAGHVQAIVDEFLTDEQRATFEREREFNMSYMMEGVGRFRVNIFMQRGLPGFVIRKITTEIPTLADLHLPDQLYGLAEAKRGLVIMVGGTGSGKSTTLAAMIGHRNKTAPGHIITIEDPVEYVHEHARCIVTQREVGVDTASFESALKNALRQKPDLILLGEIRDATTMEYAINIAETGHLCLATLHANNANQALDRVLSFFPQDMHRQVLLNLSMNLKALLSQRLVRTTEGGRRAALEILLNEGLVTDLIRKGEVKDLKKVMAENRALGMLTFDQSLLDLVGAGVIDEDTAIAEADTPADLKIALREQKMGGEAGLTGVDTSRLSL
ncbi:Twitching motility protein PilT [Caenispirillum salinarum AK4]|uniref:Twitching motility protein PilT n=1 Tax=Caenispirillum salinarum AK4 TaxID=1238182 RepID=K9H3V8_9PROT|nr:PilT/PilU family type 4a pilus ATPase [Caenispirillum salinarum]EKV32242.1 Twitching motility protein PilT [Caenispirillum salinarum AK4]